VIKARKNLIISDDMHKSALFYPGVAVKERELQNAARHPDDPIDTPGLHLLQAMSYSERQPMPEAKAAAWSAQGQHRQPHQG
jgi:hypothetical protein